MDTVSLYSTGWIEFVWIRAYLHQPLPCVPTIRLAPVSAVWLLCPVALNWHDPWCVLMRLGYQGKGPRQDRKNNFVRPFGELIVLGGGLIITLLPSNFFQKYWPIRQQREFTRMEDRGSISQKIYHQTRQEVPLNYRAVDDLVAWYGYVFVICVTKLWKSCCCSSVWDGVCYGKIKLSS